MTTLNDVPADTKMVMTEDLDRLFRLAKCVPACHACQESIVVGDPFQLVSLDGTDEMTCDGCDRDDLRRHHKQVAKEKVKREKALVIKREKDLAEHIAYKRSVGLGGYSRPSTR